MSTDLFVDIFLSVFITVFSLIVVLHRNPIVSAFSLLMAFIGFAGVYFQLGTLFLSVVQVLVYAGAIAILFIFVLMLMNLGAQRPQAIKRSLTPVVSVLSVTILASLIASTLTYYQDYLDKASLKSPTEMMKLFELLFQRFLIPFELATFLLLAVIVAVVAMAKYRFSRGKL